MFEIKIVMIQQSLFACVSIVDANEYWSFRQGQGICEFVNNKIYCKSDVDKILKKN